MTTERISNNSRSGACLTLPPALSVRPIGLLLRYQELAVLLDRLFMAGIQQLGSQPKNNVHTHTTY